MTFLYYNPVTSSHGKFLQRALTASEDADRYLKQVRDMMAAMIVGDGSADSHYAAITVRLGFTLDSDARAAFLEVDSAYAKTSGDSAVTGVRAARDQLFSKLRT